MAMVAMGKRYFSRIGFSTAIWIEQISLAKDGFFQVED
jgi:hypothetical protein